MTYFWAERAWLGRSAERVVIEVEDETIVAVREDDDPPPGAVRLPGLVLPGLANAHSHAFHRALRATTETPGDFWGWRDAMYGIANRLNPDSYLRLARAVFTEMVLSGISAVGEFHYLHHGTGGTPYADPNQMGEALLQAAAEAGLRITLLDCCYLHAGAGMPPEGAQLRFADGDVDRWAGRVERLRERPTVRIGAAIHSVRALDPGEMREVVSWTGARGVQLHMHLLERREEIASAPLRMVEEAGVLGPRTTMIHATHVDDFTVLQKTGTGVCVCRTTERFLADGHVARLPDLPLCFGSDSHAVIDLFEEARALELDERTRTGARGTYGPEVLLEAATQGGYRALGWEGGLIEPGQLADFIAVDIESARTAAGSAPDTATLVFAASAADVTDVVVGGRPVVRARRHFAVENVGRELKEAIAAL